MIKIGYFGDGPWASRALSHIAENSERFSVAFITPRFDTQDPALKEWAVKLGVPFLPCENVNDAAFITKIKEFGCDLLVSMSFNQILKSEIIGAAPQGFINCHAGALPFYRGRNPLNWALINGEEEFGVTVHYIDEGIDTGDIIVRNMVPVADNDDYACLLEKAHGACADSLLEALSAIEAGTVKSAKQSDIHPVGFYCGRRREGDEWIDWYDSSRDIYNFIRALNQPGPGARTLSEKGVVALLKAEKIPGAPAYRATSGEVVGRTENGVIVKTGDSTLLVTKAAQVSVNGDIEEPFIPCWPVGMRLTQPLRAELNELRSLVRKLAEELDVLKTGANLAGVAKK